MVLDTSSDKYTIVNSNSLEISFNNVTGADGGLYRCVYDSVATTSELCVYVFGKSPDVIKLLTHKKINLVRCKLWVSTHTLPCRYL